jgi:hypothetical protein
MNSRGVNRSRQETIMNSTGEDSWPGACGTGNEESGTGVGGTLALIGYMYMSRKKHESMGV